MSFRNTLTGLLLAALTLGAAAAEPETKKPGGTTAAAKKAAGKTGAARAQSERTCALTLTWWEEPLLAAGERLELGVQGDLKVTPIYPSTMTAGGTFLYEGPANVSVVRKAMLPDPSGKPGAKPIETWLPFTSFQIGEAETEVLAIMFAQEGLQKVRTRAFDFDVANLPFGGCAILNFSKTRLLCSMGGKVFYAEAGQRARSPLVLNSREVVNFFMGITDADGAQKLIYRAPLVMNEKTRRLYFVLDNPAGDPNNRFVSHRMIQHVAGHSTVETLRKQVNNPPSGEPVPETTPAPAQETEAPKKGAAKAKAA